MTKFVLYIDDVRFPTEAQRSEYPKPEYKWSTSKSSKTASYFFNNIIEKYDDIEHIHLMLDHDLGGEDTIMLFLKILEEPRNFELLKSNKITYTIHSANPVGRKNIEDYMTWLLKMAKEEVKA